MYARVLENTYGYSLNTLISQVLNLLISHGLLLNPTSATLKNGYTHKFSSSHIWFICHPIKTPNPVLCPISLSPHFLPRSLHWLQSLPFFILTPWWTSSILYHPLEPLSSLLLSVIKPQPWIAPTTHWVWSHRCHWTKLDKIMKSHWLNILPIHVSELQLGPHYGKTTLLRLLMKPLSYSLQQLF